MKKKKRLPGTHWFIRNDPYTARDNKRIKVGVTHTLNNSLPLALCYNGYHASSKLADALYYGYIHSSGRYRNKYHIYRVTLSKEQDVGGDKVAARWRKYVAKSGPYSEYEIHNLYKKLWPSTSYTTHNKHIYARVKKRLFADLRK